MAKLTPIREMILEEIRSGNTYPPDIYKKLRLSKQTFGYNKKKLLASKMIVKKGRNLEIGISPDDLAPKEEVKYYLNLMRADVKEVREEAIYDFQDFCARYVNDNPKVYEFLVDSIEDPEYEEMKVWFKSFHSPFNP